MSWRDIRSGNPVKEILGNGGTVIGSFIRTSSVEAVESCAHAGCQFVLIDLEHSATSWQQLSALTIAAEAAGTSPITRVSNPSRDLITRVLDIGAHGVMVAQIESAEVAAEVVAATRYGPDGTRGTAGGRGSGWGFKMSAAEYQDAANASTFVSIQIESRVGAENVEKLAMVEGIDCLFVGLSDLSADLGVPGQWADPELVAVLDRIDAACAEQNLAVGYPATDPDMARMLVGRGSRFIATADLTQLGRAMNSFVSEVSAFVE